MKANFAQKAKKMMALVLALILTACTLCTGVLPALARESYPTEFAKKAVSEYNMVVSEYNKKKADPNYQISPAVVAAANGSKYNADYGVAANTAWCVIFAWWCSNQVGIQSDIIPKTASASAMETLVANRAGVVHKNIGVYQPHVGDMVHLEEHLMIVTGVSGDYVTVTHGNWGKTLSQDTYNWKSKKYFDTQKIISYVSPWYRGDVNHDSNVNTADAQLILQMAAEIIPYPSSNSPKFKRCDVNGDNVVNTADARVILQMVAGDY